MNWLVEVLGFDKIVAALDKIADALDKIKELLKKGQRSPAVRILLAMPTTTTKEGIPVPNIDALNNDQVYTYPILTDDGAGNAVPPPAGATFTAAGSDNGQYLGLTVNGSGASASIVVDPLVQVVSAPITVTITGTGSAAGLQADAQQFTIQNGVPVDIALGAPATVDQPVPSQPGPG